MKVIARLGIALCLAAGLSFAALEEYRGKLLDASCANQSSTSQTKASEKMAQTCAPTASTVNFAILASDGKVRMLDPAGNEKAATVLKNGDLKADKDGDFHVVIMGSRKGDTLKVESIRAHKSDVSVH